MVSLRVLTILFVAIFCTAGGVSAEPLLVYYSSILTVKERETAARPDFEKNQIELVLFAKYREFSEEVRKRNPQILIAPSEFGSVNSQYVPLFQLRKFGKAKFKFQLFSLTKDKIDLAKSKIGVVETTERDQLKDLVKQWLNTDVQMVKSVTKPEDLFPLMVFQSVDAIVIHPDDYKILKEKFTTQVFQVAESANVQYPLLYMKKDADMQKYKTLAKQIPVSALNALGFSDLEELNKEVKQ